MHLHILRLQVKQDDNVEVGAAVASIAEGGAAAAADAPAAQPQQQEAQQQEAPAAAAAAPPPQPPAPSPPAEATPTHRTPSIRFPPRVAPNGERISSLPAAEAQSLLASLLGGDEGEAATNGGRAEKAPIPEEYKHMIAVPIVGGSMPVLRGMPVPSGPPGPPRRTMSEGEMEAIMLGGADP